MVPGFPESETKRRRCGPPISPAAVAGVVIMAIGFVLLLDRYGYADARSVFRYWPVVLVAVGLVRLLNRGPAPSRAWGAIVLLAGIFFLVPVLGGGSVDWGKIWPVFVIAWGLLLLWGALESRRGLPEAGSSLDVLNQWTLCGGGELQVTSQQFQGGELLAIFGGWNVDLTRAEIRDGEATVVVNTIFGGATLRVRDGWKVVMRGTAIFGGFADHSRPPRPEDEATAKRLIIRGTTVFGGVEIKN
jgi:hypothetical protein